MNNNEPTSTSSTPPINQDDIDFVNRLSNASKHISDQQQIIDNSPTPYTIVPDSQQTTTSNNTTTTTTNNSKNNNNNNNSFKSDEDYAAQLQSDFNREQAYHTTLDVNSHSSSNNNNNNNSDPFGGDGYEGEFDLPDVIAHPGGDYLRYMELKKTGTIIKALAILLMFFSIMSYFSEAWWLLFSFGFIFNPLGYYAAHYLQRRLFLMFMAYLVVDIVFRLGFLFSHISYLGGFGVFLSLLFDGLEGYMVWFCFNFYKKMPRDGRETFREFFLNDQGLFSF
ncbi:hypothetical protein CYY_005938 [Polysphondylium violaceum]|uniref:Transmembrane protein n=1 Tax=Polysphondylium violaceum TaxID=133409 RepID=A0A8J4UYH2_9MYCE|nr:hypothetical protein CYY_005938 [Polysphondylium violaceum]